MAEKKQPPKDKSRAAFDLFTSALTPATKAALERTKTAKSSVDAGSSGQEKDESTDLYLDVVRGLSAATQAKLREMSNKPEEVAPAEEPDALRYIMVECTNGEWALTRQFKTAEDLARRIGQLEGEDVIVAPCFGIPLWITKGPQRYLKLPDGRAIQIPLYEGGPCKIVSASVLDDLEAQTDGFLGPPELAETQTAAVPHEQGDDDEDDDEPEDANV